MSTSATRAPVRNRIGAAVHVWVADVVTDAGLVPLRAVLDDSERARADAFVQEHDRAGYVTAHALLRAALSWNRPDIPCHEWEFGATEYGRPMLHRPVADVCFSLSHSTRRVAVVLARDDCGIDVECGDRVRDLDLVARTVLTPSELATYAGLRDASVRRRYFFRLWTLKESYTKARGLGLRIPFDSVGFTLDPIALVDHTLAPTAVAEWDFAQWSAGDDTDHTQAPVAVAFRRGMGTTGQIVIHRENAGSSAEFPYPFTGGAEA